MARLSLFLDSSALFSSAASARGGARALLVLGETGRVELTISLQVAIETERALARKAPQAIGVLRQLLQAAKIKIVADPPADVVERYTKLIVHRADRPILAAAVLSRADYLVTLNRKHFIDDPQIALKSGLLIGTPGAALEWVRRRLTEI
jgi:predicted nucleic acid-binding protein